MKRKTSFLGGKAGDGKEAGGLIHKSISLSHVVFRSCDSQSRGSFSNSGETAKRQKTGAMGSLFSKVAGR